MAARRLKLFTTGIDYNSQLFVDITPAAHVLKHKIDFKRINETLDITHVTLINNDFILIFGLRNWIKLHTHGQVLYILSSKFKILILLSQIKKSCGKTTRTYVFQIIKKCAIVIQK